MTPAELQALLQLHTIRRWQIVEVTRDQSVVEHTYRVWALSLDLYERLFPIEHNSLERASLGQLVLIHDVDELVTGDIPATIKTILENLCPGINSKLKDHVLGKHFPTLAATLRGMERTLGYYIYKIADNVEAALYIKQYGRNLLDFSVVGTRYDAIESILRHVEGVYSHIDWKAGRHWLDSVTGATRFYGDIYGREL